MRADVLKEPTMEALVHPAAISSPRPDAPRTRTAFAAFCVLWNLYGVVQLAMKHMGAREHLMPGGSPDLRTEVLSRTPAWMDLAFALGAFGGVAGSALLLARRRAATRVLAVSLVAYIALFIGDATEGVFAALGAPQVVVLSAVVAIAAGLFGHARAAAAAGALR